MRVKINLIKEFESFFIQNYFANNDDMRKRVFSLYEIMMKKKINGNTNCIHDQNKLF